MFPSMAVIMGETKEEHQVELKEEHQVETKEEHQVKRRKVEPSKEELERRERVKLEHQRQTDYHLSQRWKAQAAEWAWRATLSENAGFLKGNKEVMPDDPEVLVKFRWLLELELKNLEKETVRTPASLRREVDVKDRLKKIRDTQEAERAWRATLPENAGFFLGNKEVMPDDPQVLLKFRWLLERELRDLEKERDRTPALLRREEDVKDRLKNIREKEDKRFKKRLLSGWRIILQE